MRVVSQSGNKKTVDMDIAGPGGQVITTELAFEYLPDEKKIVYSTVNNPVLETQAVYQLTDEGASTFIDYHQDTHMLQQMPVPDSHIVKSVIRNIFVSQLEGLKNTGCTSRPAINPMKTTRSLEPGNDRTMDEIERHFRARDRALQPR